MKKKILKLVNPHLEEEKKMKSEIRIYKELKEDFKTFSTNFPPNETNSFHTFPSNQIYNQSENLTEEDKKQEQNNIRNSMVRNLEPVQNPIIFYNGLTPSRPSPINPIEENLSRRIEDHTDPPTNKETNYFPLYESNFGQQPPSEQFNSSNYQINNDYVASPSYIFPQSERQTQINFGFGSMNNPAATNVQTRQATPVHYNNTLTNPFRIEDPNISNVINMPTYRGYYDPHRNSENIRTYNFANLMNNSMHNNSEESKFGVPPSFYRNRANFEDRIVSFQNSGQRMIQVEDLKERTYLEKVFPSTTCDDKTSKVNIKYLRIYENAKKYLTIEESSSSIHPMNMHTPYSEDYISKVGNINFVSDLGSKEKKSEVQIFLYKSENSNNEFVMKRYVHYFYPGEKDLKELDHLEVFLRNRYIEYSLMKLYSICQHSSIPIFFNIIQVKKVEVIVTEMMMEFAGTTIMDSYPITVSQLAYEYLYQLAMAINFLQEFKIENNGIDPSNIMVKKIEEKLMIKIIDFNIGSKLSNPKESGFICATKNNSFYWAPEQLNQNNLSESEESGLSVGKIQIYSMGVIFLQLISFFSKSNIKFEEFNKYKMSEEKYKEFFEKIDLFQFSVIDKLMKNMVIVIKVCLSYKPEMRPSSNEFISLINCLETKTKQSILNEIKEIYRKREPIDSFNYSNESFPTKGKINVNRNLGEDSQSTFSISQDSPIHEFKENSPINQTKISKMEGELALQKECNILILKENTNLKNELIKCSEVSEQQKRELLEIRKEMDQCIKERKDAEEKLIEAMNKNANLDLTLERKEMEKNDLENKIIERSQKKENFKLLDKIDKSVNTNHKDNSEIIKLEIIQINNTTSKAPEKKVSVENVEKDALIGKANIEKENLIDLESLFNSDPKDGFPNY